MQNSNSKVKFKFKKEHSNRADPPSDGQARLNGFIRGLDRIVEYPEDYLFSSARNYAGLDHELEVIVDFMG